MTRLGLFGSQSPSLVSLLSDGELDTLTLGQGDPRLGSFTDNENVGKTGKNGQEMDAQEEQSSTHRVAKVRSKTSRT